MARSKDNYAHDAAAAETEPKHPQDRLLPTDAFRPVNVCSSVDTQKASVTVTLLFRVLSCLNVVSARDVMWYSMYSPMLSAAYMGSKYKIT